MNILCRKMNTVDRIFAFIIHHDENKKKRVVQNEDVMAYATMLEPSVVVTAGFLARGSSAVVSEPS